MTKAEHLGGDRYRVRVSLPRSVDGKYRQLSRTFRASGQRAADRKARQIVAELDKERESARDRRDTINGLIDDWAKLPKATTTEYRNRSIIAAIRDGLGHHRLESLTARDVDLWYARLLDEGRTETTVHHYHRVLHSILMRGERWDRVPVAVTRKASPPDRSRPAPSPPKSDVLLSVLEDASPGLQLAAILAARLGLRRGEVCGLRWTDLADGRITVARSVVEVPGKPLEVKVPKTKKPRTLAVDKATLNALAAAWSGRSDNGWILPDPFRPGDPRSPGWISRAWAAQCKRHDVRIRFHDLRHWAASNMIDAGVPIKTVSNRLGHSLTSTTLNIYTAELPGADEAAAAALAERLPAIALRHDGMTGGT